MTGQLFINGKDAWLTWGAFLVGNSLDNLLLPPPPKAYTENNFRSQDGKQVFVINTKKDARDVQVEFCIKAESRADYLLAYKNFIEELSGGVVDMSLPSIEMDFKFTVSSYLSLGHYDRFGKLSVRFNESFSVPVVIKDYVDVSGHVEDIVSGVGISGANVSVSLGGHQIAAVTTDQTGDFAYQWRISESEYNNLIASQGMALLWSVQKNGYTAKEVQTNMPVYTEAVQQGITNTIVLVNPSDFRVSPNALTLSPMGGTANLTVLFPNNNWSYTASEDWFNVSRASNVLTITAPANTTEYKRDGVIRVSITMSGETITVVVPITQDYLNLMSAPVGLDFRGRTVEFVNTAAPMHPVALFDGMYGLRSSIPWFSAGGFEILFTHDGVSTQIIIRGDSGSTEPDRNFSVVIWNEVDGWLQTSFTFPDDGYPFIVGQNDFLGFSPEGPLGYWWPNYTIITD